jgi:hypothetical protein
MRRKTRVEERTKDYVPDNQCHHYWIIEVANGPKSKGVCKHCGEVRYFLNTMPDWNGLKRDTHPLDLPKMSKVKLDEESKS